MPVNVSQTAGCLTAHLMEATSQAEDSISISLTSKQASDQSADSASMLQCSQPMAEAIDQLGASQLRTVLLLRLKRQSETSQRHGLTAWRCLLQAEA